VITEEWVSHWARRLHVRLISIDGPDAEALEDAEGLIRDVVRDFQLHQEAQMAEDTKGSRTKDPELRALHACVRELSALSEAERARVVEFINKRYGSQAAPAS
jgi:hypothetical protein